LQCITTFIYFEKKERKKTVQYFSINSPYHCCPSLSVSQLLFKVSILRQRKLSKLIATLVNGIVDDNLLHSVWKLQPPLWSSSTIYTLDW